MSTIRQRLTRGLLLGVGLLLVLGGIVAYLTTRAALTRQFDDALRTKALALTSAIEQDQGNVTVDASDPLMRDFDINSRGAYFQVCRADGTVAERSPSLQGGSLPLRYGQNREPDYWNLKLATGLGARAVGLKFQPHPANDVNEKTTPVEAILVVAADRRDLDRALGTLALVLAGSGLLVLVLTAAMVPLLLRRELAPLERLAGQAQHITAESLAHRFSTAGLPGELAPISARLNDLLQRLQVSFERERRFSDDLAHEFRTPIAELRSLAELSLKWPDARSAETDQHVLTIALQMEAIISRLLAIARSDQGRAPVETQRVELAAMISTICDPLQPRAAARQLSIQADVPTSLALHSDPVLLRSIVLNLLDNAVEYSPPNGTVRVRSETRNGQFTLSVTNPVEHLSAEDIPRLFERFWRKDAARSGGEHSGLGLSLARAFATSLGYQLTATLDEDARLSMMLSGPTRLERPGQSGSIHEDKHGRQAINESRSEEDPSKRVSTKT